MKKKLIIITTILLTLFLTLYWVYSNYLTPKTPLEVVRDQSGLNISNNMQIVHFTEEWSPNGDGYVFVALQLTDIQLKEITKQCLDKDYQQLPLTTVTVNVISKYTTVEDKGLYKLEKDPADDGGINLILLNQSKKMLFTYTSVL